MHTYTSPRINWLKDNVSGKTIVDIGFVGVYDATTAHSTIIKANPNSHIIPIDIDHQLILKHHITHAVVGDGFKLPLKSNSVDTVVIAEVIEHLSDWIGFLTESARVIKPKGHLIVTTPNPSALFRILRYWLLSPKPEQKSNIKTYLGFHEHIQFIEPLSLINVFHELNFKPTITTTNLSIPYVPKQFKDPQLNFWPFNRLGTYNCIKGKKLK